MTATYLLALALTLGLELPVLGFLAAPEQRRRLLRDGLLANLFTHPLVNVLHRALAAPEEPYGAAFWVLELGVFLAEAAVFCWVTGLPARRALGISLAANGLTALLSVVVFG